MELPQIEDCTDEVAPLPTQRWWLPPVCPHVKEKASPVEVAALWSSYPPPLEIPPLQSPGAGGTITLTFLLITGGCVVLSCSFSAGGCPGLGGWVEILGTPPLIIVAWVGECAVLDPPLMLGCPPLCVGIPFLQTSFFGFVLLCNLAILLWVWHIYFNVDKAEREHCKIDRQKKWLKSKQTTKTLLACL